MELYKGWAISESDYSRGYYEAINEKDCDALVKFAKTIEELKTEIDEA